MTSIAIQICSLRYNSHRSGGLVAMPTLKIIMCPKVRCQHAIRSKNGAKSILRLTWEAVSGKGTSLRHHVVTESGDFRSNRPERKLATNTTTQAFPSPVVQVRRIDDVVLCWHWECIPGELRKKLINPSKLEQLRRSAPVSPRASSFCRSFP